MKYLIPKELESLAKEARKYDNPSDFIKQFGKKYRQIRGDFPLSTEFFWRQAKGLPLPEAKPLPPTLGAIADILEAQRGRRIPPELKPKPEGEKK